MKTSSEIHESRQRNLAREMDRRRLSAFLVTSLVNLRYVTGLECSFGMLLCLKNKRYLITDGRYTADARANARGVEVVELKGGASTISAIIHEILASYRIRKIGFEPWAMQVDTFRALEKKLRGISLSPQKPLIEVLRLEKDDREAGLIRKACAITDRSFSAVLGAIRPGVTEKQLRAALDAEMISRGIDKLAFDTIIASGPNGAFAHAKATDRKIRRGDFIVMDFGVRVEGYHSDMTRTVYVGTPDAEAKKRYNAVNDARKKAFDAAAAGVKTSALDEAARSVLRGKGLEKYFVHGLGHGVGLEVHEAPRLSRLSDETLSPGAVFTIEPGIYIEDWGGIRIEDTCLLTKKGAETLTKSSRKLISL